MNRTVLAFIVDAVLAIAIGVIGTQLGLGSWGFTALAVVALLLLTLLDRDGFYGAAPRRHAPRSYRSEPAMLAVLSAQRADAQQLAQDAEQRGWNDEATRHLALIERLDALIANSEAA